MIDFQIPCFSLEQTAAMAREDAALLSDAHICLAYAGILKFVSKDQSVQAFYIRMRCNGQSHNMAEMLALRKFPGVRGTDSQFMAGTHAQDDMIDQARYDAARRQGVDTNGKRYLSSLARFPNDPEAWVSGLGDVRRVVTDRGWNCHGAIDHTGFEFSEHERPADIPIASSIVAQHVSACLAAYDEGERTPQLIGDIRERVTQELTGQISFTDLRVDDYEDPFGLPGMQPD